MPTGFKRLPNRHAGRCIDCGDRVPEKTGYMERNEDQKWYSLHKECDNGQDHHVVYFPKLMMEQRVNKTDWEQ